ncbi:CaiB/BaiF CoA transferase family protein [Streptomyces iranensis]|uniref:Alpha-methylacyl-CoA racemase n=1 Tax=Streptomyces iranensis TaxID=576784 RepID=A0A061A6G1_9ACTN|nr:CaiB/BaiF CoA-transferase family protein [Streptomyces iranensis]MBP2063481.1 alpha-methylacyl-CoA racemase [Streptomyces iranensis]CDR17949.1 fatty acid-CoA racemase [Streptomyces iranensis]
MTGSAQGPLAGVRVLEIAGLGPAPMASLLLSELGADVVRVDRPKPSPISDFLERGRRSIIIDLKHPGGADTVLRLAERADVLIEGFRPGVAERLGIGPAAAHARNPRLVYGRMTGWGQHGPRADTAGHDINYISLTGALAAIGRAGGPPQVPLNLLGDFGGGALYLVVGVLAALHHARATGEGQIVDAAIVDGVTHLAAMIWAERRHNGWADERGRNLLDTGAPYYDVYATSDGGWMSVGALEPQFYARFVELLGMPEWAPSQHDRTAWPRMREAFAARFASHPRAEWEKVFDGADACVTPVLNWSEALREPHMTARNVHVTAEGEAVPAPAPRFSATATRAAGPRAAPGAHSLEVLEDWDVPGARELLSGGSVMQRPDE